MGKRKKRSLAASTPCAKRSRVEEKKGILPNITDFTLPGFRYLGPGGKSTNGPPTNIVDAIAKQHDEAYDHVIDEFKDTHNVKRSVEEIKKADERFLDDMRKTRAMTAKEALGKAVGLAGIGIKSVVENSLGFTLYPNFEKIKSEEEATKCTFKVRAGDDFN